MSYHTKCPNISKCKYCQKLFKNNTSLKNHIRWHDLPKYKKFQKNFRDKTSFTKFGDKNPQWKGENVGKDAIHDYIKWYLPKPKYCYSCFKVTRKLDLTNISQQYLRKFSDWEWLCRKCHMKKDGRLENLNNLNKGDNIVN